MGYSSSEAASGVISGAVRIKNGAKLDVFSGDYMFGEYNELGVWPFTHGMDSDGDLSVATSREALDNQEVLGEVTGSDVMHE